MSKRKKSTTSYYTRDAILFIYAASGALARTVLGKSTADRTKATAADTATLATGVTFSLTDAGADAVAEAYAYVPFAGNTAWVSIPYALRFFLPLPFCITYICTCINYILHSSIYKCINCSYKSENVIINLPEAKMRTKMKKKKTGKPTRVFFIDSPWFGIYVVDMCATNW